MSSATSIPDVSVAASAIRSTIIATPLLRSDYLSDLTGGEVFLKLENLQRTGSFKVRGAAFKLASLSREERAAGIVACSSGNHGRAVAYVARRLGIRASICVPQWIDPVKLAAMEGDGAHIDRTAENYDEAERRAADLCVAEGRTLIHPFDDRHILAGQGTLALEILSELPGVHKVVAPLSGGGLVGGIALGLRQQRSHAHVVAVSAKYARVMGASLESGRPIAVREATTVASALSGGIGLDNRYTFDVIRELVGSDVVVEEEEIVEAMKLLARRHRLIAEGGGATAIAGILGDLGRYRNKQTAVVVSGGNVSLDTWLGLVSD